jgi:3-dehydroquinate dehydratase-2
MTTKKIAVLNGPNLNLLGKREPDLYGTLTLAQIEDACRTRGKLHGVEIHCRQTNNEGELVSWIQEFGDSDGIILNAAAYTHTSVALRDVLKAIAAPCIEVHISNIFAREEFRQVSHVGPVAIGTICGLGAKGYELAIEALASLVSADDRN